MLNSILIIVSLLICLLGWGLISFSKDSHHGKRDWGWTVIGLAIVFFGLYIMPDRPKTDEPDAENYRK